MANDARTLSTLHTLHRASGSATYVSPHANAYSTTQLRPSPALKITSAVNFPIEISRRSEELPDRLLIEVNLRPARGVGQVRERHVEELVRRTLEAVVMVEGFPRQMCQIGLQITSGEDEGDVEGNGVAYLSTLAGCVNAALMGCLDAGVPMNTVAGAVLVGIGRNGETIVQPDLMESARCRSLHIFVFTADGRLLLAESEGNFSIGEWEMTESVARKLVLQLDMDTEKVYTNGLQEQLENGSIIQMLRRSVDAKVTNDERWRDG